MLGILHITILVSSLVTFSAICFLPTSPPRRSELPVYDHFNSLQRGFKYFTITRNTKVDYNVSKGSHKSTYLHRSVFSSRNNTKVSTNPTTHNNSTLLHFNHTSSSNVFRNSSSNDTITLRQSASSRPTLINLSTISTALSSKTAQVLNKTSATRSYDISSFHTNSLLWNYTTSHHTAATSLSKNQSKTSSHTSNVFKHTTKISDTVTSTRLATTKSINDSSRFFDIVIGSYSSTKSSSENRGSLSNTTATQSHFISASLSSAISSNSALLSRKPTESSSHRPTGYLSKTSQPTYSITSSSNKPTASSSSTHNYLVPAVSGASNDDDPQASSVVNIDDINLNPQAPATSDMFITVTTTATATVATPISASTVSSAATASGSIDCSNMHHRYAECWDILNMTGYLTDWNAKHLSSCGGETQAWVNCYLSYEAQDSGEDCTIMNTEYCGSWITDKPANPRVYYTLYNIFSTLSQPLDPIDHES